MVEPVPVPNERNATVYFRGRYIIDAILDNLIEKQGMTDGAAQQLRSTRHGMRELSSTTEVMVSGCSAGGLAVWLHLDYIADYLAAKGAPSPFHVVGVPEAGLFMDLPTNAGQQLWTPRFKGIAEMQNTTARPGSNLNSGCLDSPPSSQPWC